MFSIAVHLCENLTLSIHYQGLNLRGRLYVNEQGINAQVPYSFL